MGAPLKLTRFDRHRIEQAVEELIALLDALDGDPDLEDDTEDVGCEDEGFDSDSEEEPGDAWRVVPHLEDQTRPALVTPYLAG